MLFLHIALQEAVIAKLKNVKKKTGSLLVVSVKYMGAEATLHWPASKRTTLIPLCR